MPPATVAEGEPSLRTQLENKLAKLGPEPQIIPPVEDGAPAIETRKGKLGSRPSDLSAVLAKLAERLTAGRERLQWIRATQGQNLRLIPVADVLFFQSDEKYTRVVTAESEALIKTPIRELLDGLDPEAFCQIHRSTVVNVKAIASVSRDFRGQAHVKIKGKDEALVVSRIYSHPFNQM